MAGSKPKNTLETYWSLVDKTGDCWKWMGCSGRGGYGLFSMSGKQLYAHRIAYESANGSIPKGMFVCHACDNPNCVNPLHLFLGTMADNVADMWKKNRGPRGETNGHAKLDIAKIKKVRVLYNAGCTQKQIANKYCVHPSAISRVLNGKRWRHVRMSGGNTPLS